MVRHFLEHEQCEQLKKFAQVMAFKGQMRRFTDDRWITMQMALAGVQEPMQHPNAKFNVLFFNDENWCYLVVRHCGHTDAEENGLSALRIDRQYLTHQFAPLGRPDKRRMEKIVKSLLCLLNIPPDDVNLESLFSMSNNRN